MSIRIVDAEEDPMEGDLGWLDFHLPLNPRRQVRPLEALLA